MKFAVRLIKNTFHPLKVQDDVNLSRDQLIIVRTEKGEEVHRVIIVNDEIAKHWQKYKPEALSVVRVMTDEDLNTYKEQKEFETIDETIADLETQLQKIEDEIMENATNSAKLNELMKDKETIEQELDDTMERWVYLNELAEKIKAQNEEK